MTFKSKKTTMNIVYAILKNISICIFFHLASISWLTNVIEADERSLSDGSGIANCGELEPKYNST